MPLLKLEGVTKRFGGLVAVDHVDLEIDKGESIGIVGPNARASGISTDIRKIDPYFSYDDVKFKVIKDEKGDILTRINLRFYEIMESLNIIDQLIEKMPDGKIRIPVSFSNMPDKEVLARVEAPRGELAYYIRTSKGKFSPDRVKIRTPTYATLNAIPVLLKGLRLADVSIAVMSIDPCVSCTDRVTILDVNTGKSKIITGDELRCIK